MVEYLEKARRFRKLAEQLLEIAAEAGDPEDREILEEVAREYDRMADAESLETTVMH